MEFLAHHTKDRWSLAAMRFCAFRLQSVLGRIVLAGGLLLAATWAWAAENVCPAAVVVDGASEIAPTVSLILKEHGVGPRPTGCGTVIRAELTRGVAANTFTLRIVDGYGRSSDRQVASAKDAASLIESWATAEDSDLILPPAFPALPFSAFEAYWLAVVSVI